MATYSSNKNKKIKKIKIAGRSHILPPLGIAWKTKRKQFPSGKRELKLNVKLSKISSTRRFQRLSETIITSLLH
jgi:hypothetical protein